MWFKFHLFIQDVRSMMMMLMTMMTTIIFELKGTRANYQKTKFMYGNRIICPCCSCVSKKIRARELCELLFILKRTKNEIYSLYFFSCTSRFFSFLLSCLLDLDKHVTLHIFIIIVLKQRNK